MARLRKGYNIYFLVLGVVKSLWTWYILFVSTGNFAFSLLEETLFILRRSPVTFLTCWDRESLKDTCQLNYEELQDLQLVFFLPKIIKVIEGEK